MTVNFCTRAVESGERENARLLCAERLRSSRMRVRSSSSRVASLSGTEELVGARPVLESWDMS
jgi:hypothetical protein